MNWSNDVQKSLNWVPGSSGAAKTHLQEKIGELMPVEDVILITSLSENAFYYFQQTVLYKKKKGNADCSTKPPLQM